MLSVPWAGKTTMFSFSEFVGHTRSLALCRCIEEHDLTTARM